MRTDVDIRVVKDAKDGDFVQKFFYRGFKIVECKEDACYWYRIFRNNKPDCNEKFPSRDIAIRYIDSQINRSKRILEEDSVASGFVDRAITWNMNVVLCLIDEMEKIDKHIKFLQDKKLLTSQGRIIERENELQPNKLKACKTSLLRSAQEIEGLIGRGNAVSEKIRGIVDESFKFWEPTDNNDEQ